MILYVNFSIRHVSISLRRVRTTIVCSEPVAVMMKLSWVATVTSFAEWPVLLAHMDTEHYLPDSSVKFKLWVC